MHVKSIDTSIGIWSHWLLAAQNSIDEEGVGKNVHEKTTKVLKTLLEGLSKETFLFAK